MASRSLWSRREQRSGRDAEIALAGPAAEAQRAARAASFIGVQTAASRAYRGAVSLWPAHLAELRLGFRVRHAEHLSEAQVSEGGGDEGGDDARPFFPE